LVIQEVRGCRNESADYSARMPGSRHLKRRDIEGRKEALRMMKACIVKARRTLYEDEWILRNLNVPVRWNIGLRRALAMERRYLKRPAVEIGIMCHRFSVG
jgi:hypothetical protein